MTTEPPVTPTLAMPAPAKTTLDAGMTPELPWVVLLAALTESDTAPLLMVETLLETSRMP